MNAFKDEFEILTAEELPEPEIACIYYFFFTIFNQKIKTIFVN